MERREAIKRTIVFAGITVSGSAAFTLLEGCQSKSDPSWQPVFFTKQESVLVSSICNIIIPKTETPGAIELRLHEFVDIMLNDCITDAEKIFRKPLNDFSEDILKLYSKPFEKCSPSEKHQIVSDLEEKSNPETDKEQKFQFYIILRDVIRFGYLSSEYVMNNLLDYQPIPIEFKGCIDVNNTARLSVSN